MSKTSAAPKRARSRTSTNPSSKTTASTDETFLALYAEWQEAGGEWRRLLDAYQAKMQELRDAVPEQMPDVAVALGYGKTYGARELAYDIKKRKNDIEANMRICKLDQPPEEHAEEYAAIRAALPAIQKRAAAIQAVDTHPDLKPFQVPMRKADARENRLCKKLVSMPVSSAKAMQAKLKAALGDNEPDRDWADSLMRDLKRMAGEG